MSPNATTIEAEGVYSDNFKMVDQGRYDDAKLVELLTGEKYPVRNVGRAVVRGIEKRSKAVHVPGWVGALKYFRAFTPMVVDRQAVEDCLKA